MAHLEIGSKYKLWQPQYRGKVSDFNSLRDVLLENRSFQSIENLEYGDFGLERASEVMRKAIESNKKVALYADYDVDGTMSCVSWIWFFEALNFRNYTYYIPDRFKEGYGLNLDAIKHLIHDQGAQVIITMDTGITANEEASYCLSQGVEFICTDHHKIQPDKMPDCIILNPKTHPDETYQELCGCGITFVLLRRLSKSFQFDPGVWTDILALTGMATICDLVPLNGVNHKLARLGVQALMTSQRPVLKELLRAASVDVGDEKDVGFRLGPRINAVGRLEHAHQVIEAFISGNPEELIKKMGLCNERRKKIQEHIIDEARHKLKSQGNLNSDPIIFLGGEWHAGVVGIAASKLVEENWKPTWLFEIKDGVCKGSARSIEGFDVTEAMSYAKEYFIKFGGHKAAGGFSFDYKDFEPLKEKLIEYASLVRSRSPEIWDSKIAYDCSVSPELVSVEMLDFIDDLKPFGHKFEEPLVRIDTKVKSIRYYNDKLTGLPKHTAVEINVNKKTEKVMFFNEVIEDITVSETYRFLVSISRHIWNGRVGLNLFGKDYFHLPD